MRIKYWGVRGSIPTPERRNSRYGGNTTCIEVRLANGTLIILDCGSGLRGLGKSLLREFGERPIHAYVFLTHFPWDPINGNGAVISSAPLNPPGEAVAYRIDADGASFVLATDTEPGSAFHDRAV